ncbi:Putrescine-binding periplasmic protein precursor [compost metagenome]
MAKQIQAGALKKLDKGQLPNWKNLNPVLLKALEVNDPGNQYGFPYLWGSTGIGYNVERVKAVLGDNAPVDSWDLFFKPENMEKLAKCGVAVLDNGPELLPITLNYLGLPHHSQKPEDYKTAQAELMKVRPYITYFHSSKYVSDLANGDICVAVGFSGDILQAATRAREAGNGVNIQYSTPKEGSPLWFDMIAMPADAPDEAAGYAFMNYLLRPEVMAGVSNFVHYANGNVAADPLVEAGIKADPAIYPPADVMKSLFALESMPQKIDRVRTRVWNAVKTGR